MAEESAASAVSSYANGQGTGDRRGGRGGRRGGAGQRGNTGGGGSNHRFSTQGRSEQRPGRGRGSGSSRPTKTTESANDALSGSAGLSTAVNGHSHSRPIERAASRANGGTQGGEDAEAEAEAEAEVCFICASDIVHQSVAPCNHRTCHICSLRMRALYKSRLCPHCRTEATTVIFTDDAEKRYEDFSPTDIVHTDENLGIKYERKEIEDDTILLLRYNCPDEECDVACFSWPDLHRHVRSVHHKQMCDLCTRHKKVFTHEHHLYTKEDLRRHEKFGDHKEDQTGFKGHPECGFCRKRFYGDDELYVHCREQHEKCHLCERANPQRQHQYYVNYDSLEQHFRKDHFLCPDSECLDKKFVVFGSEMDLKAHQLESHPNGLSKDARRDARRVDMAGFDYRQPHDDRPERRRGGRSGGGGRGSGGRGRDPNAEPLPPSSAQPLRRDEIAYQRQMAIQSAQSVTTRTFGGQLSSTETYAAQPAERGEAPATVNVPRTASAPVDVPAVQNLRLNNDNQPSAASPHEQARQMQHQSVVQRASQMLANDSAKIKIFRDRVSSYRLGSVTATQMVDSFIALFDVPAVELGKLIKELADLYDNEQRRTDLLTAWNDWRAINEDYPSLPGPSGSLPSTNTASSGRRILKLKSSTAQSQRAPARQSRTWGNIATSGVGSGASGYGASKSANRAGTGRVAAVPWAGPSGPSPAPIRRPVTNSSAERTSAAPPSADAFPSLPAAAKPNTMMAGLHRGAVPWLDRNPAPSANAWAGPSGGGSGIGNGSGNGDEASEDATGAATAKKKGRKGKQTTLYHFG